MTDALRTIHLPDDLCRAAERKFAHQFGTVEDLVSMILSELLREDAELMDAREEQIIEARLSGLGYV